MVVILGIRVMVIVVVVVQDGLMIYQCSEVPGNISRENQTCCDSTAVFREPGGAMVRVMGGPAQ